MQKLLDVAVGLKDARTALRLKILLQSTDDTFDERSEGNNDEDLKEVVEDAIEHGLPRGPAFKAVGNPRP